MSGKSNTATWTETIPPATARAETLWVALAALAVVSLAAGLIGVRGRVQSAQELTDYQVSAYSGLNPTEQGIYNDLLAASLEVDNYHADTLRFPSVPQLQGQYIAPFVKDLSWKKRGELEWKQDIPNIEQQHTVAYYALSAQPSVTGSFLLWMTHKHNMTGPMAEQFFAQRGKKTATAGPGMQPLDPLAQGNLAGDLSIPGLPAPAPALGAPRPGDAPAAGTGGAPKTVFKPQVRVWYHPGTVAEAPTVYLDEQLIKAGWREVIARTGTDETKALRGNAAQ